VTHAPRPFYDPLCVPFCFIAPVVPCLWQSTVSCIKESPYSRLVPQKCLSKRRNLISTKAFAIIFVYIFCGPYSFHKNREIKQWVTSEWKTRIRQGAARCPEGIVWDTEGWRVHNLSLCVAHVLSDSRYIQFHGLNPLKPSGKYMYHLLYQPVTVHSVFMGLVWVSV
jgi:hypothetical protein